MIAGLQHASYQSVVVDHRLALAHPVGLARVDQDHVDERPAGVRDNAGGDETRPLVGHDLEHSPEHLVFVTELLGHRLPLAELGVVVRQLLVALVNGHDAVQLVEPAGDRCRRLREEGENWGNGVDNADAYRLHDAWLRLAQDHQGDRRAGQHCVAKALGEDPARHGQDEIAPSAYPHSDLQTLRGEFRIGPA